MAGALFSLIITGQWLAGFIVDPCHPFPRGPSSPDVLLPPARESPMLAAAPGAAPARLRRPRSRGRRAPRAPSG
jgi:hypothetical protein